MQEGFCSQHPQDGRRRVGYGQGFGIVAIPEHDHSRTQLRPGPEFSIRVLGGNRSERVGASATQGQARQRLERAFGASEARQQGVKRDRADLIRARKAQPISSLLCAQAGQGVLGEAGEALAAPIFGSSPFSRR